MRFPLKCLIVCLPFAAIPRLFGMPMLSNFAFLFFVGCAILGNRLKFTRYMLAYIAFFTLFAIYGFYKINYDEVITIVGGWDVGLLSTRTFQFVELTQTIIYIVGGALYAKYLLHPKSGGVRFQFWYFMLWSAGCLIAYLIENKFSPSRIFNPVDNYMCGTFYEKGDMAVFVTFIYALFITCIDLPNAPKFSRLQISSFVGVVLLDLLFCKSDRGTIVFIIFNLFYFISRRPAVALRLIPLGLLLLIALMPLYGRASGKIQFLVSSIIKPHGGSNISGRYAAILMTPAIFEHSPFFGVGYGNYNFYRNAEQYAPRLVLGGRDNPDNALLEIFLECGIIGFSTFVALIVVYPGYLLVKSRVRILWPFYLLFLVSLTGGITGYFLPWTWLFILLTMIRICLAAKAQEVGAFEPPRMPMLVTRPAEAVS